MKTIVNRTIVVGIISALLMAGMLLGVFFIAFPTEGWLALWERKVFEFPFIIFVPVLTILFGALIGMIVGIYWKRQLIDIEKAVSVLTKTKNQKIETETSVTEIAELLNQLVDLQKYINEQTKRTQKLIDERVEDQEQKIEQVISEERNRLARELHDSVSQELFAASMLISAMNELHGDKQDGMSKQMAQVERIIQQAQLEMRALLLHLRPVALKNKSLKDGMEQLLEELRQKVPLDISWKLEHVHVSRGIEDHLFRILQESVSNTLRHSKASSVDILLIERDNAVILRVSDDGIGFNVEEGVTSSYGILNMKERAAEIGGDLRVISVPNEGTRLEVRVPIMNEEDEDV